MSEPRVCRCEELEAVVERMEETSHEIKAILAKLLDQLEKEKA